MRVCAFSARNSKELLRDPISLVFGVGLPVALLFLMQFIQRSTGGVVQIFELDRFTPGIAMFSLTFLSMFAAMLVAGDRDNAFLARLFASPMKAGDFLAGYCLPLLPLGLIQGIICFFASFCLGLKPSLGVLYCLLAMFPAVLLFTSLGLLMGAVLRYRQVGPIASILVQVAALSSGMWFDLELIGGAFQTVCRALPFARALELMQGALRGSFSGGEANLAWTLGYTAVLGTAAVLLFRRSMKN